MYSFRFTRQLRRATVCSLVATMFPLVVLGEEPDTSKGNSLGIAELIHKVRQELEESEKLRIEKNRPALFKTKELELELNFVVRKSAEGKAGFDLVIVSFGGEGSYTTENVQKIRLLLEAGDWSSQTAASGSPSSQTTKAGVSTGGLPVGLPPGGFPAVGLPPGGVLPGG